MKNPMLNISKLFVTVMITAFLLSSSVLSAEEAVKSYKPDEYYGEITFKSGDPISYVWIGNSWSGIGIGGGSVEGAKDSIAFAEKEIEIHPGKPGKRIFFSVISKIDFLDLTDDELQKIKKYKAVENKGKGMYTTRPVAAPTILKCNITYTNGSVKENVYLYPDLVWKYKSEYVEGYVTDQVKSIIFHHRVEKIPQKKK